MIDDLPLDAEASGEQFTSLAEQLAQTPPGVGLGVLLASVDRSRLDSETLLQLARARVRQVAHLEAQLLADLHTVARVVPEGDPLPRAVTRQQGKYPWAEVECAFALRWTHQRAATQLQFADELLDRLPQVFAALDAGRIDVPKAHVVSDLLASVDQPLASALADRVLDQAAQQTTSQLRARLRRLVLAADAEVARKQAREGIRQRRVAGYAHPDNHLATLAGYELAPHRVAAVMERLDAIARAAKAAGDSRTVDQLRADTFLDLLTGDGVAAGGPVSDGAAGVSPHPGDGDGDEPAGTAAGRQPETAVDDPVPWPQPPPDPWLADPPEEELALPADPEPDLDLWAFGGTDPASSHGHNTDDHHSVDPVPGGGTCPACGHHPETTSGAGHPGAVLPAPRCGVVELQVPLTTLMHLTDLPGELAGWGPVVADIARQVTATMHHDKWRVSIYNPLGELAWHGTTTARPQPPQHQHPANRRPTSAQAAYIRARDRTCVAPGCQRTARQCDLDHTTGWAAGGPTTIPNLGLLCRRHHQFKHATGCELEQDPDGRFRWSTPTGMHYLTTPHRPLLEPPLSQSRPEPVRS